MQAHRRPARIRPAGCDVGYRVGCGSQLDPRIKGAAVGTWPRSSGDTASSGCLSLPLCQGDGKGLFIFFTPAEEATLRHCGADRRESRDLYPGGGRRSRPYRVVWKDTLARVECGGCGCGHAGLPEAHAAFCHNRRRMSCDVIGALWKCVRHQNGSGCHLSGWLGGVCFRLEHWGPDPALASSFPFLFFQPGNHSPARVETPNTIATGDPPSSLGVDRVQEQLSWALARFRCGSWNVTGFCSSAMLLHPCQTYGAHPQHSQVLCRIGLDPSGRCRAHIERAD